MVNYRSFRYAGNKINLMDTIFFFIDKYMPDFNCYIEPFLGSGSILYNLKTDKKPRYIVSDIDEHIISMHKAIRDYTYEDYVSVLNFVLDTYGDIKIDKTAYYAYRTYWNTEGKKDAKAGLLLLLLANSCINSMLRFGPNGMNQGFGHRHYVLSKECYNHIHDILADTLIIQGTYLDSLSYISSNAKTVVFFDPPYQDRQISYHHSFNKELFILKLVELSSLPNLLMLYTDVDSELSDILLRYNWSKQEIRSMRTICPTKHSEFTKKEVIYHHIN